MKLRKLKMINNTDIRNNQQRLIAQTGSDDNQFPLKLFHFDEFNFGARRILVVIKWFEARFTDFRQIMLNNARSCNVIYPTDSFWMYSVINSLISY